MSDSDSDSDAGHLPLAAAVVIQFACYFVLCGIAFAMAWHYAKKYYAKKHAAEQAQAHEMMAQRQQEDGAMMPLPHLASQALGGQETGTSEAPRPETPSTIFTRQGGGASSPVVPFPEFEEPVSRKCRKADEGQGYVSSHVRN